MHFGRPFKNSIARFTNPSASLRILSQISHCRRVNFCHSSAFSIGTRFRRRKAQWWAWAPVETAHHWELRPSFCHQTSLCIKSINSRTFSTDFQKPESDFSCAGLNPTRSRKRTLLRRAGDTLALVSAIDLYLSGSANEHGALAGPSSDCGDLGKSSNVLESLPRSDLALQHCFLCTTVTRSHNAPRCRVILLHRLLYQ